MEIGRVDRELNNLIFYINEYQKAKVKLEKAVNKSQIDDAKYDLELNLLTIENVFNLNNDLRVAILPAITNKADCIKGSFLSVNFITDVNNFIQKTENCA